MKKIPVTIIMAISVIVLGGTVVGFVSCCANTSHERREVKSYPKTIPHWVGETFPFARFVTWESGLPEVIKSAARLAVRDVLNPPLRDSFGVSDRFLTSRPGDGYEVYPVHVKIVVWKGGHCLSPDLRFADIVPDAKGFKIRLCVEKALTIVNLKLPIGLGKGGTKTQQEKLQEWYRNGPLHFWECVVAHELGRTYWYTPPRNHGLMTEGSGTCHLTKHELDLWEATVLPHITEGGTKR